ncbi:thymidylate kinase [Philodulcilactobacillus myokoensis]|uniref:Thymidylate kinase n=1 Tax=Philodulcilactobacillus myokoensis TaxID=2929573 RepID=A0A9W6B2D0_9LACO|nr:dTMP kinase [Philodulcilactobacillus myokoensis]GLB47160.1 thymidylate kinase [Philodulcilactobacillus myokoensis]
MSGKFITIEGSDGAGKTTVLSKILKIIQPIMKDKLVISREPGGNPIAEEIRDVILNPKNTAMDSKTEALLYAAARRQNVVQTILPALKHGKLVLCDRFLDSSIAYQGGGREIGTKKIFDVNQFATDGLEPDVTIYLNVPFQLGIERIKKHRQNDIDRLDREKLSFHKRVHDAYQELLSHHSDRIKSIDASQPIDKVVQDVLKLLKNEASDYF